MRFLKVEGAGNDFVCVDALRGGVPRDPAPLARAVCDRQRGVGADGLLIIERDLTSDARMVVWNADGSRSDMCGNALRCVALVLVRDHGCDRACVVATDSGPLASEVVTIDGDVATVRTSVGSPEDLGTHTINIDGGPVHVQALRVGNPVCVVWTDQVDDAPVTTVGPTLEVHEAFPDGTNVAFAEVVDRGRIRQRTWERGCGETLACGTGASAVCVAGVLSGRTDREVSITLPGGALALGWPSDDAAVSLTGSARIVFEGSWPWR